MHHVPLHCAELRHTYAPYRHLCMVLVFKLQLFVLPPSYDVTQASLQACIDPTWGHDGQRRMLPKKGTTPTRYCAPCRRSPHSQVATISSKWRAGKVEQHQGEAREAWELQSQPPRPCNRESLSPSSWRARVTPAATDLIHQARVAGA